LRAKTLSDFCKEPNVCAEPHLFQSKSGQTADFERARINGRSSNMSICFVGCADMATYPCIDDDRCASCVRVLVVEDHEPFRQSVCSMLEKRPELQIVGEVSDGLEAVNKAAKLQPDLILLDVGLPSMNGIEAARRIRKLSPKSKILFVTQETSDEVVQEAFNLGAWGYVVKIRTGSDLLPAVDAVRQGKQFVGAGHVPIQFADILAPKRFHPDEVLAEPTEPGD
jgi:CheY-like chemotaxis protein